ncbi:hypothetical protein T492DRAFT_873191 [Pavlovales sp. CCMP2436]|nr:hypothetical protein T492DRAFT_873191 [Pavlovales sp. CCMP2436]
MYVDVWGKQRSGVRKIAKRQGTAGEAHQWAAKKAEPTFDFVGAAEAAKAARAAPPQCGSRVAGWALPAARRTKQSR